ncbi:MAG: methylmalonyl-CoA mutase family protein [Thermoleophilia bacterium]
MTTDWRAERERWERETVGPFAARQPERRDTFETVSGIELDRVYTAEHAPRDASAEGLPGEFPFLRGPYPTMYRARPWTMRQIAGYGRPEDTNDRLKYLIANGQTGISIDFDMPTLMGFDSDDERSLGEVGREGVAIDHVDDLHGVLDGIDIGSISVSMTINPTAWILLAMLVVVAEERGVPLDRLSGTTQADIVKEFIAQKEWIYPVEPSLRLLRDMITFGADHLPRWNPVNISGYHVREAGATAVQEVAFTLAAAITYAERAMATGVPFDAFAPRFSFFFIAHSDFLEEIAKFRAARRLWARIARERFGAQMPESMRLRFHCQTSGSALTAPQPLNNIARGALQALAAVLGGAQSLHVSGMDEALAIPSELAMKTSLRTQQILLEETGVADTIDPLGGSYAIEALTDRIEADAQAILDRIDELGGTVACIEAGWFQQETADSAYRFQLAKEAGERVIVGVNRYRDAQAAPLPFDLHRVDPDAESRKIAELTAFKEERDRALVDERLAALAEAAAGDGNVMPATIAAVRARATGGEIVEALRAVYGTYVETAVF